MLDALIDLGYVEMEVDKDGEPVIPNEVENLFSLMDFKGDKKISEEEFMRATMHYRNLAKLLTITLLEDNRKKAAQFIKEQVEAAKNAPAAKTKREKFGLTPKSSKCSLEERKGEPVKQRSVEVGEEAKEAKTEEVPEKEEGKKVEEEAAAKGEEKEEEAEVPKKGEAEVPKKEEANSVKD